MRLLTSVVAPTTLERDCNGRIRPLPQSSKLSAFSIASSVPRSAAVASALTLVTVVWGSVAFGAVYPWAFWPLAALAVVAGLAGLLAAALEHTLHGATRPAPFRPGFGLALAA